MMQATKELLDNPLFLQCRQQFREALNNGLVKEDDEWAYWQGFCKGVTHACNTLSSIQPPGK